MHRLPHRRLGFAAHRWREVDEELSVSALGPPWPKRVSEEVEACVGIRLPPVIVLAVDDPRLGWMQFQSTPRKPRKYSVNPAPGCDLGLDTFSGLW